MLVPEAAPRLAMLGDGVCTHGILQVGCAHALSHSAAVVGACYMARHGVNTELVLRSCDRVLVQESTVT